MLRLGQIFDDEPMIFAYWIFLAAQLDPTDWLESIDGLDISGIVASVVMLVLLIYYLLRRNKTDDASDKRDHEDRQALIKIIAQNDQTITAFIAALGSLRETLVQQGSAATGQTDVMRQLVAAVAASTEGYQSAISIMEIMHKALSSFEETYSEKNAALRDLVSHIKEDLDARSKRFFETIADSEKRDAALLALMQGVVEQLNQLIKLIKPEEEKPDEPTEIPPTAPAPSPA